MTYAIDEVPDLVKRLKLPPQDTDPVLQYLCALFSELAYYHVPPFEFEDTKRAKLIPCSAYQTIIKFGRSTSVAAILPQNELFRYFIIVDRGVVIVGVLVNKILFIAFRGTQFLFDWQVNLRSTLTPLGQPSDYWRGLRVSTGEVHSGFGEEAVRAALKIRDELKKNNFDDIDHAIFTGHSLGGAVAAIAELCSCIAPHSVCIFGSPRYATASTYNAACGAPAHVRRSGDVVPMVPPRYLGYADHPREFTTQGDVLADAARYGWFLPDVWRWGTFLATRFCHHNIEEYRREVGEYAAATGATIELAPVQKLTSAQVSQP